MLQLLCNEYVALAPPVYDQENHHIREYTQLMKEQPQYFDEIKTLLQLLSGRRVIRSSQRTEAQTRLQDSQQRIQYTRSQCSDALFSACLLIQERLITAYLCGRSVKKTHTDPLTDHHEPQQHHTIQCFL